MDGTSRSHERDKGIPHGVMTMEQPVLCDKGMRIRWASTQNISPVLQVSDKARLKQVSSPTET